MSRIAIITTTYKHQDFIAQTIESILSQSFTDWELLIGDDSPDDLTWNIIEKYRKLYPDKIRSWHHIINKGIVANMNFLIEQIASKSEYVVFLEWDDLLTPDAISTKLSVFSAHPEVVMIYNNFDFIDQNWVVFFRNFLKKAPYYIKNTIISVHEFLSHATWYGSYSTLMYRKWALDNLQIKNPTIDKLYSVSDWDLFFRTVTAYPCYGVEQSLTQYRRHSGNLSAQNMKIFDDLEILMTSYLENWIVSNIDFSYQMSLITLFKSVAFLEKNQIFPAYCLWKKSFGYTMFSYLIYKAWVWVLMLSPAILRNFLLRKIIHRNS